MSEQIEQLPSDNIPLDTHEKDVFQWLYPSKEKEEIIQSPSNTSSTQSGFLEQKSTVFYVNLIVLSVLIFCSGYPPINPVWDKLIPIEKEKPLYTIMKVFIIFFVLYVINYMLFQKNEK